MDKCTFFFYNQISIFGCKWHVKVSRHVCDFTFYPKTANPFHILVVWGSPKQTPKYIILETATRSVKEPPRSSLSYGDSGSEEGLEGSSPAGSPRPEHRSLGGLLRSTHRALLGGGSLLASVALGRHLDVPHIPPRVPPRTNPHHHPPQEVNITAPKVPSSDPPVVDDLITFSSSEPLPRPLFDFPCALHAPEVKPLHLTPPPPNPRERACHRHAQALQTPQSPQAPRSLHHQTQEQASPGEWVCHRHARIS